MNKNYHDKKKEIESKILLNWRILYHTDNFSELLKNLVNRPLYITAWSLNKTRALISRARDIRPTEVILSDKILDELSSITDVYSSKAIKLINKNLLVLNPETKRFTKLKSPSVAAEGVGIFENKEDAEWYYLYLKESYFDFERSELEQLLVDYDEVKKFQKENK